MLEIRMLGHFDIRLDDQAVSISSRPAQSLLAYLALSAGTAHRREKLAGLFWPDSSESNARSSLRHALWRIRRDLGGDKGVENPYLLVDNFTIAFAEGEHAWVDALVLAREPGGEKSLEELVATVSLYGGDLLPGFYDDWIVLERERLRAVFEQKMQALLDRCVTDREWSLVLEWAERWITLGDVPEPAYRALMIAYDGMGDAARVAATYRRCREALEAELGVSPSDQTEATYAWLVKGGPPPEDAVKPEGALYAPSAVDAAENLLERWVERDTEILDVASLALIHGAGQERPIRDRYAPLLIRSALHHNVDVNPWIARLPSPQTGVNALIHSYEAYQKPGIRRRIIAALDGIADRSADEALRQIALSEADPQVRERAAVAIARRGQGQELMPHLAAQLEGASGTAAMTAFVAIADEVGRPEDLGPYPRGQVNLALAQRRWRRRRSAIWSQTVWAAIGSGFALGIRGAFEPFLLREARPESFQLATEIMRLSAGMFSGFVAGLIIGVLHGGASGLAVGLADALDPHGKRLYGRFIMGGSAGLIYTAFMILFAGLGFKAPEVGPGIYVPAQVFLGIFFGLALTLVIPRLGSIATVRRQFFRVGQAMAIMIGVVIVYNFIVYRAELWISIFRDLSNHLVQALGLALALSKRNWRYWTAVEQTGR